MLRAKLAAFASALILAGSTFAGQGECPDLRNIQAEGLSMAQSLSSMFGYYAAYSMGDFGMDSNWVFGILPIEADSEEDALEYGNEVLSNMTAPGVLSDYQEVTLCTYDTGVPMLYGMAVKGDIPNPMQLRQYLPR